MIRKAPRITALHQDLFQRIELAHVSCANIVADLRNASLTIWSGVNDQAGLNHRSALGWAQHFQAERQRLMAIRTEVSSIVQRVYPEMIPPIQDYVAEVPLLVADIQAVIDRHDGRNEPLTQAERNQLADAIAARLEA